MRQAAELGYATATDLADWLVREADIPFREAHHITGAAVKLAEERGVALDALPLEDLQAIDARIDERVFAALSVDASVASRNSYGGTAPEQVRAQIARARKAGIRKDDMSTHPLSCRDCPAALAACGQRAELETAPGEGLPVAPLGSERCGQTAPELLELDPQAAPERSVELRHRSEEREDDPFDLPPPE